MSAPDPDAVSRQQCADAVLMVRRGRFGSNPETAATNTFQQAEPSLQLQASASVPAPSSSSSGGRSSG